MKLMKLKLDRSWSVTALVKKYLKLSKYSFSPLLGGTCSLLLALSSSVAPSASAAERLTLKVGPLEQSLTVDELEAFGETGELPSRLKLLTPLLTPQIRQLLNKNLQVDPNLTDRFLDELFGSSEGEKLIQQLKQAFPEAKVESLKAALFLAARQTNELNLLNFLRAYPSENLTVDLTSAAGLAVQFNASSLQSKFLSPVLDRELKVDIKKTSLPNFDPTEPGDELVRKQSLFLDDERRQRTIPVDIYYSVHTKGPLVVMSHGFGSDRRFLKYLAVHLASRGITVASLEHPGSDVNSISEMSLGASIKDLLPASEFVDRPKDVSFLLDRLAKIDRQTGELQGKFNTKEVTVIGHSFGGYTALALAGARLNPKEVRTFCDKLSPIGRSPADWLQCAAADLPYGEVDFRDRRVAQAIALNPMVGHLFDNSLRNVTIPTLILASSEDTIAPNIEHQLRPFSQLGGEKYLAVAIGGTHMSVTDISNIDSAVGQSTLVREMMGEEAEPVRKLARGLSLAFIAQLEGDRQAYQPFLNSAYVQSLSDSLISFRFATQLPTTLNPWLSVLNFSKQQLTVYKSDREDVLAGKLREYIIEASKILPQPVYRTGQLERTFSSLFNNYNQDFFWTA
jgi:predicted dienelactone hydrolase